MAKIANVNQNLVDINNYYQHLRSAERFTISRVCKKRIFLPAALLQSIRDRSYLKGIAELWQAMTSEQKLAWKNVSPRARKNGWQMFVKDQCIRIKSDLAGQATPNEYHQDWIGIINMEEGAGEFSMVQQHPTTYNISRLVTGKKSMYQTVEVKENFYLPLQIGLNYKSDLQSDGTNPYAKFYARIISHYQGRDIENLLEIDLDLSHDWQHSEATMTAVLGVARYYDLYFHLNDVKGELYFDNIEAVHNGQNWARDPYCDNIDISYTRSFQQVAKNWVSVIDNPLALYTSGYLDEV